MKTKKNKQCFLVLIPHRDTRDKIKKNANLMIKNGLTGVYNFPFVVPLASLSEPLDENELKTFANSLKASLLKETSAKSKINIEEPGFVTFPAEDENMTLFGRKLNLGFPAENLNCLDYSNSGIKKITNTFSPLILGTFLFPNSNFTPVMEQPEETSFRAAAVANMSWVQNNTKDKEIIFKWKIDKLFWLPKADKADLADKAAKDS